MVELHGVVRSMLAVAPGWAGPAWARAAPRDLGGISASVLHAEDMISHLAVHSSAPSSGIGMHLAQLPGSGCSQAGGI